MDASDIMGRQESILILPNNTLRLIDLPLATEVYKLGDPLNRTKMQEIHRLICRKEKSLGRFLDVDQQILDQLLEVNYPLYYKVAPQTVLYEMLDPLFRQSFVSKITVAFTDKRVSEQNERVESIYYENNYESLVNMLLSREWTCLILDSVDLLDKLTLDKRLDFTYKTVFLSKIGYNYEYNEDSNMLLVRNFDNIFARYRMEIYTFDLFNFTKNDKEEQ